MRNDNAQNMRNIGVIDLSDRRTSPVRTTTAHPLRCFVGRAPWSCAGTDGGFFHRRDVENGSGGSA